MLDWQKAPRVSITVKIGGIFVLISLVFVTLLMVNAYLTKQLMGASAAINHAGMQRMRVYKLPHLIRQLDPTGPTHLESDVLLQEVTELEQVLSGLERGDPERGLLEEKDPDVILRIHRIRDEWRMHLKPALEQAIRASPDHVSEPLQRYTNHITSFVSSLSELVNLIERRAAERIGVIYGLQILFLLIAGLLGAVGIYVLHRVVRFPLQKLTEGVEQVSGGRFDAAIPIHSQDELGRLARMFEMMSGRIRTHIEHLEALHASGRDFAMLGAGGLEPVLRRTVDLAADLVEADLALMLVRHPVLECWLIEAASGKLFDSIRKQVLLFEQTPFANQAFDTKEPVSVPDLNEYQDKPILFRHKYGARSFLGVPLLGPHGTIGVLVLLTRNRIREFTDRDIRLAQESASYAAIAIENARLFETAETEFHELQEKVAAMERHIAELTHEVKAPAGRVAEFASWIERDYGSRLDDKALRYLDWIKKEGQDLAQLAARTLDLAKMFQERSPLENVDANDVVREVVELLADPCSAHPIQVRIVNPLPRLACRRIHLKQVLENLISNAMKFMGDQTKPSIEIGTEPGNDGVRIFVRDNGVGMAPEMAEKIFLPFQRLGTVEVGGAGIGLTIVKTVVEHYGGKVAVTSKPGQGSTFYVQLPILGDTPSEETKVDTRPGSQWRSVRGRKAAQGGA